MCDQTEISYIDGEIVWVKLGARWWPGEVVGSERLPPDVLPSFKKPPIAVVKFFDEDSYEYVKNISNIYKYNCSRKNEFIKKGLDAYRSKNSLMEKFPEDVVRAEKATEGDENILNNDEFLEQKKESYAGLFGDSKKTPASAKKGKGVTKKATTPTIGTPTRRINKGNGDYKVHILLQSKSETKVDSEPSDLSSPSTSHAQSTSEDNIDPESPKRVVAPTTPSVSSTGIYTCHACPFTATRMNVMIFHSKTHSGSIIPYTPSPVRKKVTKPTPKIKSPSTPKTSKLHKLKIEKAEKSEFKCSPVKTPPKPKVAKSKKRVAEDQKTAAQPETKKTKTDEEIKTSLLADWDDGEEDLNEEDSSQPVLASSPEVPMGGDSPARPHNNNLTAQIPEDKSKVDETSSLADKPESSDAQYDFCEDEEWPIEAVGRKIPRVKSISKRKSESKSIDEDEVAKEVAALLNSTTVPELPQAPAPLKAEENFPERTIVKSPDKNDSKDSKKDAQTPMSNTIFKTKTFFRSRHSRSQDIIGKYIAEQLNAADRMNTSDTEMNGAEAPSSPEARDSPPIEIVRPTRLAPKIQLKKMKAEAEAAQLKEQEKDIEKTDTTEKNINNLSMDYSIPDEQVTEEKKKFGKENKIDTIETMPDNEVAVPQKIMSESTASAVDALLSVSLESDRVTKTIGNDPPENLFEDDIKQEVPKESVVVNTIDTHSLDSAEEIPKDLVVNENQDIVTGLENIDKNDEITESDLQIAQALINLPSTTLKANSNDVMNTIQSTSSFDINNFSNDIEVQSSNEVPEVEHRNTKLSLEMEDEKTLNFNAAQLLVEMSEAVDHKIQNVPCDTVQTVDESAKTQLNDNNKQKVPSPEKKPVEVTNGADKKIETQAELISNPDSYKRQKSPIKVTPTKPFFILQSKEKILNFDVGNVSIGNINPKVQSPKQKIIIRRATPAKNLINKLSEPPKQQKIILSRSNKSTQDDSAVQTYTIQSSSDVSDIDTFVKKNTISVKSKLQNIKPKSVIISTDSKQTSKSTNENIFDINSMPIVLSDDVPMNPECVDTMPLVIPDEPVSSSSTITIPSAPRLTRVKEPIEEKIKITPSSSNKKEIKSLIINNAPSETTKSVTPNILSKSNKLKNSKPVLVIDKSTGKQKIIMTKTEPITKDIKPTTTKIQTVNSLIGKSEKFIILPTSSSPKTTRTQKIVIDPKTGKAHVLLAKDSTTSATGETKNVSAKLIPSGSATNNAGGTVMIITNAQGNQSRIVLAPEHEKLLFPNKMHTALQQPKTTPQRIIAGNTSHQIPQTLITSISQPQPKTHTKIVPKQKSAIITSKGQLIIGGRVSSTTKNIAPMPPRASTTKRVTSEPKKIINAGQKTNAEPLIFLQQKSGAVMQLTTAQFEHLQRTGQIVQKPPPLTPVTPIQENKVIIQKSITINPNETLVPVPKQTKARSRNINSSVPAKKAKKEQSFNSILSPPVPPLVQKIVEKPRQNSPNTIVINSAPNPYPELDNFEELLPSTAIARQPELVISSEPTIQITSQSATPSIEVSDSLNSIESTPTTSISQETEISADGAQAGIPETQIMAVPGEHLGGLAGAFYLCIDDNGVYTPIDNRPLVLENNQLVPIVEQPVVQPERRDILEAALANSDVFDPPREDTVDFRDLNANVSVHSRVSETSTTLNQPIMTPVVVPSNCDSEPAVPANIDDGLAVIGVSTQPHTIPTSLELPITVTDPRIAPKTSDPLTNTTYTTTLIDTTPSSIADFSFVSAEHVEVSNTGSISMPLLTDDDMGVGRSMPILTDDVAAVSSVESTIGSPSSLEIRESETEDVSNWSQRLLVHGSDVSETSSEIVLQPNLQITSTELSS